jgi:hypothetical protein
LDEWAELKALSPVQVLVASEEKQEPNSLQESASWACSVH